MILIFFFHVARFFPHIICVFPLQIELCEQLHSPGPGHPTDVFMLCFAVDDRPAFQAITHKWLPQLKTTFPFVPVVLVACKIGKFRHIIVWLKSLISYSVTDVCLWSHITNPSYFWNDVPISKAWTCSLSPCNLVDLRSYPSASTTINHVTYEEGNTVAEQHGSIYCETSALLAEGVTECFNLAVSVGNGDLFYYF